MSSAATSFIVFAFVFVGAMLGMLLRAVLPEDHVSEASKDVVKMGMGLVATMSALVLGLLISSAKSSFDALSNDVTKASSEIILLDQTLQLYGPESKEARDQLRTSVARVADRLKESANLSQLRTSTSEVDSLYQKIQELSPKDDRQRSIQTRALTLLISLQGTRWLMYEQEVTSISRPMLVILISWLTALFISFGLFAPANGTAVATLLVSALSVSAAILLILELYTPYQGIIKVSIAPLHAALAQLGN